jgi:cell division protein FtsQ
LYPVAGDVSQHRSPDREPFDAARLVDLEAEQESPFLRGQKRVSVRRGSLPKKTANRLIWVGAAVFIFAFLAAIGLALYSYGEHSWRFRIDSSDQIEVAGAEHVSHAQIMEVMGGDIGRNIFFVPLAQRKQQLEQIPWVESASVMRFVPNRLRIEIHERTPVAFARIGSHISLIDAWGTLMEVAPNSKHKYSFPVIAGMNAGEPLSTRAARMKTYNVLVRELDSSGAHYSQELSEVDLNDPEDVKVLAADANGEVLVHLGSANYLQRYTTYVTHVQQWRQQFDKLDSVDLRYDGQIIVNPDLNGMPRQPSLTPAAAKAAMAAGVKPAAIVNYEKYVTHPIPAPAAVKKDAKSKPKITATTKTKTITKTAVHHPPAKPVKAASSKPLSIKSTPVKQTPVRSAPMNQTAVKTQRASSAVVAAKNTAALRPVGSAPNVSPAVAAVGQKKPSAGIPKETPQN